jgi:hypothetical protein
LIKSIPTGTLDDIHKAYLRRQGYKNPNWYALGMNSE